MDSLVIFSRFNQYTTSIYEGGKNKHGCKNSRDVSRDEIAKLGLPFETSVAMVKAVWNADVGSVASLRWIMPVADKIEDLVLAGRPTEANSSHTN